jgi:hypothetical protein
MKKIAVTFLLLFGLVQAAPTVISLFSDSAPVFIVDEEKGEDKTESDKKEKKKDYAGFAHQVNGFAARANVALLVAEKIAPFPCLEKLTPPPNFC